MDGLSALRTLFGDFLLPPSWGTTDCCQLAARYVQLRTGVDHAAKFAYTDKPSALRLLAEYDGLVNLIASCLGAPHETPEPWDLVVVDADGWSTTGIYNGHYVLGIHPDHGLVKITTRVTRAAWSF